MTPPPRSLLICATVGCGLVAAVMFLVMIPQVTTACGMPPLDTRHFWTRSEALELVRACGGSGIAAYTRLALLDLIHPALVATCLVLWLRWSRAPHRVAARIVQGLIILGAALDYLENWTIWTLLNRDLQLSASPLLAVGGGFSLAKNILISLGFLGAAALILDAKRRRVQRRGVPDAHIES